MNPQSLLATALAALILAGCAGGPLLHQPDVNQSDVNQARQALASHRLAPSLNLPDNELLPRLDKVWKATRPAIFETCRRVFSHGCDEAMKNMRLVLVPDMSVNAYADPSKFTIGIHKGFMRSAGDDDEIAAVLAHEAAHLLFSHAQKKASNAVGTGVVAGLLTIAVGAAVYQPGMDPNAFGELAGDMFEAGYTSGYVAYSPEMELEADQFAMYVLKQANRRLTAGTDLIVRLHRGEVPAPVRRGDGWAGYLQTHPAGDYRLAAMQSTLEDIRMGATVPLTKEEALEKYSCTEPTESPSGMRGGQTEIPELRLVTRRLDRLEWLGGLSVRVVERSRNMQGQLKRLIMEWFLLLTVVLPLVVIALTG